MPTFVSGGVSLAYDDLAPSDGPAARTVVLVHGYASNRHVTWRRTGWPELFRDRGVRLVILDQRGHGESDKPYDPADYTRSKLGADINALLDHLQVARADLIGHSMGCRVAVEAALTAPERISSLTLCGTGAIFLDPRDKDTRVGMAQAMLADDPATIVEPRLRSFRRYAQIQGEDLRAMGAFTLGDQTTADPARLATLAMPVLVMAGERDNTAGDPAVLARVFPRGRSLVVPGADHFSVLAKADAKAAVLDFLDELAGEALPA